ncbi:hypothetical protein [Trichothermofontia sp.]
MVTHLVTAEVPLQDSPSAMQQVIEAALVQQGNPLRWAVTAVNLEQQTVLVEAIVTIGEVSTEIAPTLVPA